MDIVKPKSSYEIRLVPAYVRPITVTVSAVMLVGAMLPGMFWMFFGAIFFLCAFASCAFFTYARDARTLQTLRDHDVRNLLLLTCGNETNIPHTKMRRTQFYAAVRRIVARSDQQRQIRFIGVGEYNGVHVAIIVGVSPQSVHADAQHDISCIPHGNDAIIITNTVPSSMTGWTTPAAARIETGRMHGYAAAAQTTSTGQTMPVAHQTTSTRQTMSVARQTTSTADADRALFGSERMHGSTSQCVRAPRTMGNDHNLLRQLLSTSSDSSDNDMGDLAKHQLRDVNTEHQLRDVNTEHQLRDVNTQHQLRDVNTQHQLRDVNMGDLTEHQLLNLIRATMMTANIEQTYTLDPFRGPRFYGVCIRGVARRARKPVVDIIDATLRQGQLRYVCDASSDEICVLVEREDFSSIPFDRVIADAQRYGLPDPSRPLTIPIGYTVNGTMTLANLPEHGSHMLVVGATRSGKSTFLHAIIASLIHFSSLPRFSPHRRVELALIDLKSGVEFAPYNGLDCLWMPVVSSIEDAEDCLHILHKEMLRRFRIIRKNGETSWSGNWLVVIIDEWNRVPESLLGIMRVMLRQGRAAGMHFILTTHRPTAENVDGDVRSQLGMRAMFLVTNQNDARLVFEGADLPIPLGNGDFWFQSSETTTPIRVQSPLVDVPTWVRKQPKAPIPTCNETNTALFVQGKTGAVFFDEGSITRNDCLHLLQQSLMRRGGNKAVVLRSTMAIPDIIRTFAQSLATSGSQDIIIESFGDMICRLSSEYCVGNQRRIPALTVIQRMVREAKQRNTLRVWAIVDKKNAQENSALAWFEPDYLVSFGSFVFPASLDPFGHCARATRNVHTLVCINREDGSVLWVE